LNRPGRFVRGSLSSHQAGPSATNVSQRVGPVIHCDEARIHEETETYDPTLASRPDERMGFPELD
jgi:hypothetical protein